jgi:hypothetical protein
VKLFNALADGKSPHGIGRLSEMIALGSKSRLCPRGIAHKTGRTAIVPNGANDGEPDGLTKRVFRLAQYQGKFREGKRAGPMLDSRGILRFFACFGSIFAFQNTC